eukprot:SAG31_NODE_12083_length_970_cov_1.004592_2_plen_92_part_01
MICLALIFGSLVLAKHVAQRTVPHHRLVLLSITVVLFEVALLSLLFTWETSGLTKNGDKLLMALITLLFVPQCLVFPTCMTIGSMQAAKGTN